MAEVRYMSNTKQEKQIKENNINNNSNENKNEKLTNKWK